MTDLVVQPPLPISDTSTDTVVSHTPTVRRDGARRNLPIQWLRAVAAISVMLYHSAGYLNDKLYDDRLVPVFSAALGYIGVALFFAISGYLMSIAIRIQSPATFLAHRIVRIYPLYFIVANADYLVDRWTGHPFLYNTKTFALLALFKLKPFLGVEWTLVFEIAFYAMLFLIAWCGAAQRIWVIAAAWLAILAIASLVAPDPGLTVMFPLYHLLFVSACVPMACGLLLPYAAKLKIPAWLLLGAGCAVSVSGYRVLDNYDQSRWVFGLGAVLIVWGAIGISEESRILRLSWFGDIFARFGDYSYALYLVHVPTILLCYRIFSGLPHLLAWALTMGAALGVAAVFGQIDISLYARLKAWLKGLSPRTVRIVAYSYFTFFVVGSLVGSVQIYRHDRQVDYVASFARAMLAAHPVVTPADAVAAGEAAGLTLSPYMVGSFDRQEWKSEGHGRGLLTTDLWGADIAKPTLPVGIALFRGNKLLRVDTPNFVRHDIRAKFGVKAKSGYFDQTMEPCHPDQPIIAVIVDASKRFAVLPYTTPYISCVPGP